MDGDALINLFANIVSNGTLTVNPTYVLQLINLARDDYEGRRMWQVLKAKNASQTAASGFNAATSYPLPSPAEPSLAEPYFMESLLEGTLVLVDPVNSMNIVPLVEMPYENQNVLQQTPSFYIDYANRLYYIMANLSGSFTICLYFKADFGDIKATQAGDAVATTWVGYPARYAKMLAFQAASRYRLGSDYDDISARNAEDNTHAAEQLYKQACTWDSHLALNGYQHRNYSAVAGGGPGYGADAYGGYNGSQGGPGRTLWNGAQF